MGTPDRSERLIRLRRLVLDAMERARDHSGGRLSDVFARFADAADVDGLTRDDFYRAARADTVEKLSQSKLSRLAAILDAGGFVEREEGPTAALVRALESLSRTSHLPERLLAALPHRMLCLRRSYLAPDAVNVSHVEITREDVELHYRETRAGSLGSSSQRSEIRGSVLWNEEVENVLYVIGHNEFRTNFAVEEAVSMRTQIVVLSVLSPVRPPSFAALAGVHVGLTPDNNPDLPGVPYAATQVFIETERTLAEAAQAQLIQNHPLGGILKASAWTDAERRLLKDADALGRLKSGIDPRYGLLAVPTRRTRQI